MVSATAALSFSQSFSPTSQKYVETLVTDKMMANAKSKFQVQTPSSKRRVLLQADI